MSDVTLHLGDCLSVLRDLPDGSVDAVVMDPPYGVEFDGKNTKHTKRSRAGYRSMTDDEDYVRSVVIPIVELCIERFSRVIVTPGIRNLYLYPKPAEVGGVYCPSGAGLGRWGFICFHPILYYGKCPYLQRGMGHRPNGFSSTERAKENGHPCPKPIGWMRWLVQKASLEGQTILDPFMGSGTTGVACIETGRRFIGVEIDPAYFAIAERRIAAARREVEAASWTSSWPSSVSSSAPGLSRSRSRRRPTTARRPTRIAT